MGMKNWMKLGLALTGFAAGAAFLLHGNALAQSAPPYAPPPTDQAPYAPPSSAPYAPPSAPPGYMQPAPVVVAQPYCQPYSDTVVIGHEKRVTRGTACLQPDGAWELHPTQAAVNYVNRGGAMFLVPAQPFATLVIHDDHLHRYH